MGELGPCTPLNTHDACGRSKDLGACNVSGAKTQQLRFRLRSEDGEQASLVKGLPTQGLQVDGAVRAQATMLGKAQCSTRTSRGEGQEVRGARGLWSCAEAWVFTDSGKP